MDFHAKRLHVSPSLHLHENWLKCAVWKNRPSTPLRFCSCKPRQQDSISGLLDTKAWQMGICMNVMRHGLQLQHGSAAGSGGGSSPGCSRL